jgi:hypothetical protein
VIDMVGVFITKGMTVAIPPGGLRLSIGEDGTPSDTLTIHVHFDVCPTWLDVALKHLRTAKRRRTERVSAWIGTDENAKARALEKEFESSMQAIMASAIALDAFYAGVQARINLPAALVETWRSKRTSRYIQIAEVLRRGFKIRPQPTAALRKNLREIFRYRDLAVHPSGRIDAPILHPELGVGVEWRFAYFRYENALLIVRAIVSLITELATAGKPVKDLRNYMEGLRPRVKLFKKSSLLRRSEP